MNPFLFKEIILNKEVLGSLGRSLLCRIWLRRSLMVPVHPEPLLNIAIPNKPYFFFFERLFPPSS